MARTVPRRVFFITMAWNDLQLSDRARMIQMAVNSGITDLSTIHEVYNKFAEGGYLYSSGGDKATLNNPRYNSKRDRAMYDYLKGSGLNHEQASGILGNLAVESYLNADLKQLGGGPAYGLMQAEAGRQKAMRNYNEVPYVFGSGLTQEEQQQLDYIINKGIKSYTPGEWGKKGFKGARQARQAFLNTKDVNEASDIITNNFLRPGKPHISRRRAMSDYYYTKFGNKFEVPMNNYEEYKQSYLE